jgi:cell division protein FtsW (lipid II flippase)
MGLAKVTFIISVKVCRYGLCGCVAACYIKSMVVCVLCRVKLEADHAIFDKYIAFRHKKI